MRIGVISRQSEHSSKPDDDDALFSAVGVALSLLSDVTELRASDLQKGPRQQSFPYDVIVTATRHHDILNLLEAWSHYGVVVVNDPVAVRAVMNRPLTFARLARHGVATPATGWSTASMPGEWVLHKGAFTSYSPVNGGPPTWHVVQERHDQHDGETKLYSLAGQLHVPDHVRLTDRQARVAESLAQTCFEVTGLVVFGMDVLWTGEQPIVIDVNDFPTFADVRNGPQLIATTVLADANRQLVAQSGQTECS